MQKNFWDAMVGRYIKSIKNDLNADFAYERLVNSLSILSLCDNQGNVLDLGCGDGRFTKDLASRYTKVVGVDYSIKLLRIARSQCPTSRFILHNLEDGFPKFKIKFDLVICKLLLMYISDIENIARESYKVLSPGGLLVLSVAHPLKWISEFQKGNIENKRYLGYLSETEVLGKIANDTNLKTKFINRTFQTYVNTFTKYGFKLETVLEPGVPDSFVLKYPDYLVYQKKPYRLNLKFIKS